MQQPATLRTDPRTLGARIAKRVELQTGSLLAVLEREAYRRLTPILERLPFASRRQVQRLALRVERLERRWGSRENPSAAHMLVSLLGPLDKGTTLPLVDARRIEQALQRHLTVDERRLVQARFGLLDGMGTAQAIGFHERRLTRRALKKLWSSSCQADT